MPSFCVVSNCEHKYASATNISFHKFPLNNAELLKKWIEFTDRGPDWFPSKWSSICSRHFLPSDFRIQHLRKCLKRSAFPSVTMKSLDFNSIPASDFSESHYKIKRIVCRLCARSGKEGESKSIAELNSTLVKCLPGIRLNILDNLPNEVCGDCIKKLVQYSLFIDRVASVQKEFFDVDENDDVYGECWKESTTKPIIIKQEPVANIKQEIFEFNKSSRAFEDHLPLHGNGQDYYTDGESDAYCEFCDVFFINNLELKNHIVSCHSENQCNPRDRANNCEIMEIITLENAAFIDLDLENCVEEATTTTATTTTTVPQLQRALKVEKQTETDQYDRVAQIISVEHNYARAIPSVVTDGSIVRNLKQEELNGPTKTCVQIKQPNQSMENELDAMDEPFDSMEVAQNEQIETEQSAEKCAKCSDVFDNPILLNEHMETVHAPKTKICPICTAHCKTISHYFMHRNKYHNWSKRRRPKRKFHYKCRGCSKMFLSKFAFENHTRYTCASLRFECSICHLEFSSGTSMLIHKRICKILMGKSEAVDNHTKVNRRLKTHSHRKEVNSSLKHGQNLNQSSKSIRHQLHRSHRPRDEKDYKATNTFVPSVAINNAVDSTRHYRHVENVILDVNAVFLPLKSENLNEEYVCSCGKSFKSFDKLNAHETTHPSSDSQLLYICNICNKEFPIRSYLHQHLVTHDNERKHKCTMCTKTFKRVAGLNQHIRGYHYKIKPHICTVCKHSYALKGDMRRCRHSTLQNKA